MAAEPKNYFLIGVAEQKIKSVRNLRGAKPPSLRQVLQNFVHYRFEMGETEKMAASLVIKNLVVVWNEIQIKTRRVDKCEEKLLKEYNEWHSLSRYQNRQQTQSEKEKQRITEFTERLDEIFDVKLIETPTKVTFSSSEALETFETEAEVVMEVDEPLNSEVGQAEQEPGCSSECVSRAKKRSSAIDAEEKFKRSFQKSSDEDDDEEGKELKFNYFVNGR